MKDPISVKTLTDQQLVQLLKDLQKRFDAGPPTNELVEIIRLHSEAYDELLGRGYTELQIEWMIYGQPSA